MNHISRQMPIKLLGTVLIDTAKPPFLLSFPSLFRPISYIAKIFSPIRTIFHPRNVDSNGLRPSSPLPRALPHLVIPSPLRPPLLRVQNKTEHIKRELRELQAHVSEAALRLVAQDMGALPPEAGDGFADGEVGARGVGVDVAGVGDLGEGGGGDEVDFGVGERFEGLVYLSDYYTVPRIARENGG